MFTPVLNTIVNRTKFAADWFLHKFPKAYAIRVLEQDTDIKTLSLCLGIRNIITSDEVRQLLRGH